MKINGIQGLSNEEMQQELQRGARFVMYQYCISIGIMTFKRPSAIYFIRAGNGSIGKGVGFTAISLLLGWWGIPWGPIYTVQSVWVNFSGGRDVTREIVASTAAAAAIQPVPQAARMG